MSILSRGGAVNSLALTPLTSAKPLAMGKRALAYPLAIAVAGQRDSSLEFQTCAAQLKVEVRNCPAAPPSDPKGK